MCFSATASFVAGTALSATGAVTLAETKKKSDIPFASIPLLFGIQQFVEGAVWLSFQYSAQIFNHIATYAYLGLAYVLWPIFVPLSVGLLETDSHRKKILYGFQFVGLAVGLYLLYFILSNPVASQIVNKSIVYSMPSQYGVLLVGMYLLATCVSPLFSSHRIINILGVLATVSFSITYYFFTASYVSVWCFFAAVLSLVVYLYFMKGGNYQI
ncbi:MAG: hypothetical protein UW27_C0017G0063 [Parcubacteria group bacterium GW2011_GWA1_44_13]|uniref:Uncharacterized protein n=1 Tax=Candidatus Nomurabacteria bacterium GW2011_GWB1_44_12 TaxID=1618748 RepID=A0A837I6U0_9BACT|nr:MAG: hypothetical protein UW17_C0005G0017 [Candidatus Nomurabacteria bacterium GW2011_GWD1_44_10]KKT36780.1 MAG: hypothetical protein UW25_C0004G0108 [Candidatus Nomurabacteria bacterium GW2011_GWB1_44_12]KKT37446.1 MAG: hypothetical protein UW27_C0017G0063 [Parcubacteria group bacterium GW2011_GWA1_44_13]HBB43863.1 hypothetical protein [Candidatus Yonathbacteria bacterium]